MRNNLNSLSTPKMRISKLLLIIGVILVSHSISLSTALSFNLASFESVPPDDVAFNGDASISGAGLELNRATTRSAGRALYRKPMQLFVINHGNTAELADFTCHFALDVSSTASSGYSQGGGGGGRRRLLLGGGGSGRRLGDVGVGGGFAFVMVPDEDDDSNWSTSRYGGLLGLFDSIASAVGGGDVQNHGVVAVEFDEGLDPLWDFSSDHVGIDVNSLKSKRYINLTGGGFMDKGTVNVLVTYNSTTNNLSVSLTFSGSLGPLSIFHIVDLREVLPQMVKVGFTASTGSSSVVIHRITSWSFSSPDLILVSGRDGRVYSGKLVGLGVGVCILVVSILVGIGICLCRWFNSGTKESERLIDHGARSETHHEAAALEGGSRSETHHAAAALDDCGVEEVPYESISVATRNFSDEFQIGKGGSGAVYRCELGNPVVELAVKKIENRTQGLKEFSSELRIVSKARHRNVVKLVSWSRNSADLLLCYEFMAHGSLDNHLRGERLPLLPWPYRYQVMRGVAAGVEYLHEGLEQHVIIHRDIKSANVLLDIHYNAKVADFGVSRLAERGESMKTTAEYGTWGYAAPEVAYYMKKASTRSDVYSFGILLLEVVTGIDPRREQLVPLVWGFYVKNDILAAVDNRLGTEVDPIQAKCLLLVGLQCCNKKPAKRPDMEKVLKMLNDPHSASRLPLDPPHSSTAEHGTTA